MLFKHSQYNHEHNTDALFPSLLDDTAHILRVYGSVLADGALQVYHSVLPTMPSCHLWRELICVEQEIPLLISERSKGWGSWVQVLEGHNSAVVSVAYSPDGKLIASGSWDQTVRVWNAATGTLQHTLTGHNRSVYSVGFSPDGKHIASCSSDQTVRVWDAATGTLQHTLTGHNHEVNSVGFSPDGKHIASGSRDQTVRVWNAATGTLQHTLTGHNGWVNSVGFSPDGKHIASGSRDQTVRVWDAATGTLQHTLTGHNGWVSSIGFSPDGKHIASGSSDQTVRVWDAAIGTLQHTLTGHNESVNSVGFSSDSQYIVTRDFGGTAIKWDARLGSRCDDINDGSLSSEDNHLPVSFTGTGVEHAGLTLFSLDKETGWINRQEQGGAWRRVCWLPLDLRGDAIAYSGQKVVIGSPRGDVTILDFSRVR
jgi:WD40 repeat protein